MQIVATWTLLRRFLAAPILLVVAAAIGCGGGGDGGGGTGPGGGGGNAAPASVTFEGSGSVSGTVGSAISATIAVIVRTTAGNPVPSVTVNFTASAGTLGASSAQTDAQGRASAGQWTLGTTAGTQTVTAQAGSVSSQLVAVALAGPAVQLAFGAPFPATVRAGAPIIPAPAVRAGDQFNNTVAVAGRVITATLQTGAGVITGEAATTDASGIATFSALTVGGIIGTPRVVSFASTGLPSITSGPITLEPGLPATIELQNTPTSARAGIAIAPVVTASLADAFGNVVTRPPTTITVTVAQGGGVVTGGTALTDVDGRATFPTLAIEGLVGDKQLRFSAGTATRTTAAIPLFPGDPTQLVVTSQPTRVENTLSFATPVRVQVSDRFTNGVGGSPRTVTATLATGGGTLQSATESTDAGGLATFASMRLIGLVGPRTIAFSSSGLASATSASITLDAGPVRSMTLLQAPSGAITVGTPFTQQPALQLADTSGNQIRRAGVYVRASILDATGELLNDGALTDLQGLAAFHQLTFLQTGPLTLTLRLRFSSGGLASLTTGTVTVQPAGASSVRSVEYGVATQRLFIVDPGKTLSLTGVARDGAGQAIAGIPMVFASSNPAVATVRSSGTITGEATGSAWVRAFGAGAPSIRDSVYVTIPRDATAPIVSTTQLTPIPVRSGSIPEFDVVIDTRGHVIGAATILVGMPPELVDAITWQGASGTIIGLDSRFNALRISLVSSAGVSGVVMVARIRITAGAPNGVFEQREIVITPIEMVDMNLQNLAPRSTGVNIPLIP